MAEAPTTALEVPFEATDVAIREASDAPMQDALVALRHRAQLVTEVVALGLQQCRTAPEACCTRYGEKFRLTKGGASRVLRSFGATATFGSDPSQCGEYDEEGRTHWQWMAIATVSIPGVGSYDGLGWWGTSKPGYESRKITTQLRADIRKCANTQALINACEVLFGLNALTAAELAAHGIETTGIKAVSIGGGEDAPETAETLERQESVRDLLESVGVETVADCDKVCIILSAFTGRDGQPVAGKPLARQSAKQMHYLPGKIAKIVEAMKRDGVEGPEQAAKYATALAAKGGR